MCSSNPCCSGVNCLYSSFDRWNKLRLTLVKQLPQHHMACSVGEPWHRMSSFASLFFIHSSIRTFLLVISCCFGLPVGFFTPEPPGKPLIVSAALLKVASCQPSHYWWGQDFPGSLNLLSWSECWSSLPSIHPFLCRIQPLIASERASFLPLQHSCSGLYPLIPPWTVFSAITLLALSPPPPCLFLQLLVFRNTTNETTFLSLTSSSSQSLLLGAWTAFLVFRTCQLLAFPNSVTFKWEFSLGGIQLLSAELCSKPNRGKALSVSLGLRFYLERFWNAWFKGVMRWNIAWQDWGRVAGCLAVNKMFVSGTDGLICFEVLAPGSGYIVGLYRL